MQTHVHKNALNHVRVSVLLYKQRVITFPTEPSQTYPTAAVFILEVKKGKTISAIPLYASASDVSRITWSGQASP